MALKGQKRRFAEAIVSAKPLKISNREAALKIGCSERSASASGSRCMADAEVRAYIVAHWPDYFDPTASLPDPQTKAAAPQTELPLFCVQEISAWLENEADEDALQHIAAVLRGKLPDLPQQVDEDTVLQAAKNADKDSSLFANLVKTVCDTLRVSTDPIDQWDSILIDPFASIKQKHDAAVEKAKYTKAKPAAMSQKEIQKEKAQAAREERRQQNAVGDFFGFPQNDTHTDSQPGYKSTVPVWKN